MDHRPKCNCQNYKTSRKHRGKNNCHEGLGKDFSDGIQNWIPSKFKTLILQKKIRATNWENIFWKNVSDKVPISSIHKGLLQLKIKKTIWWKRTGKITTDTRSKKAYKRQISTWKATQYFWTLKKGKLKQQWDKTTHSPQWLILKWSAMTLVAKE